MTLNNITQIKLKQWAQQLGFQGLGVSGIDLSTQERYLKRWLANGSHGDMEWMERHGNKRTRPEELEEGTMSVISVRMDYLPPQTVDPIMVLNHPERAYVSRYALGRDYHKIMRKKLEKLAKKINEELSDSEQMQYRVFVDSAPVMEKPIAVKAGLGWMGKHTNILSQNVGSWFFLGEIYTNLPLTESQAVDNHCGDCTACIDVCPTKAIIKPYELDARRCISYLTIEHKGVIPVEFREPMGNRIYGCDDCQLICPWNRFAVDTKESDFSTRNNLDSASLLSLFAWSEEDFLKNLEGSAIRRIGYERWQRNIAIALGNAPSSEKIITALNAKYEVSSEMVREHISWALQRLK
ncbi:tRNA epoxyqueuosine(34) reductase QueG [Cocleimonas sp. KMM 6892]|uniref:tRNA epoxyqueuosine(34) reductase QueG n=1 Tax=unclassified Cocleimonas TaxID=2639732 RepID=UPI002DBBCE42|nr:MULTISPECIES: tRNA epoxyqueuosine(34) reductase QueG [unclassified Cocleimonas]MEB8431520.1 tRNA epoxyqueuosine(34) reductase QueG [Cocleimonas sp. KMM 6892]MEC4713708.1 tRNA epoxyqueuosine(34) reductase QueG [Cocleimonas sp. KMM 6895]MEC4743039.1 tRNA epoxyqueuosine(34) reductase QueG [Cocleimonas sp. KMM 6896]